ncbi:hypothetical protein ACFWH4_07205 [Streptomyces sp. NPDC127091]|uniref:hypothetical protein n=1 Tax=Streptomyces sp. NPDC127091 TaxID=3347134 RepID=UPI00364BFAB3
MADGAYGDLDDFRCELHAVGVPFVMAVKRRRGIWAYGAQARTPVDAARESAWDGPGEAGDWTPVVRTFRDGHTAIWWAADATLGFWGPDGLTRLVVATTDPAILPEKATGYLATDLPRPGSPRAAESPYPPTNLAEIVRIYGIRTWIEQGYQQVKDELGWADFQVRSDAAILPQPSAGGPPVTRPWSTARSPSAGRPGSPPRDLRQRRHRHRTPTPERGGNASVPPCWPKAIRAVRGWLTPAVALQRWWRAWSNAPRRPSSRP